MTRERAIEMLEHELKWGRNDDGVAGIHDGATLDALEMAIASLKTDEAYQLEYENRDFVEIPEGMTNREIISEFVEQDDSFAIMVDEVNGTVNIELSLDFWNTPYKKGGEEK